MQVMNPDTEQDNKHDWQQWTVLKPRKAARTELNTPDLAYNE
jgi:hypothetical protein